MALDGFTHQTLEVNGIKIHVAEVGDGSVGAKPRGSARISIAGDARRTQQTHTNTVEHTNEREGEYSLRDITACSVFD